jgi:hypothetical protein
MRSLSQLSRGIIPVTVVIVSEVVNRGKFASRSRVLARAALYFFFSLMLLLEPLAPAAYADEKSELQILGDCNWQVTYRGRTYDLSPLTREALTRPIDNDIRYALQRVPEANAHLEAMGAKLHNSRVYTVLASAFLLGFVATRLALPRNGERAQARNNLVSGTAGGLFLTSLFFSWRNSRSAKDELVGAVREFNDHSPYKIEPAMKGDLLE